MNMTQFLQQDFERRIFCMYDFGTEDYVTIENDVETHLSAAELDALWCKLVNEVFDVVENIILGFVWIYKLKS